MFGQQQEIRELGVQIVPGAKTGFLAVVLRQRIVAKQIAQRIDRRFHVRDRLVPPDEDHIGIVEHEDASDVQLDITFEGVRGHAKVKVTPVKRLQTRQMQMDRAVAVFPGSHALDIVQQQIFLERLVTSGVRFQHVRRNSSVPAECGKPKPVPPISHGRT